MKRFLSFLFLCTACWANSLPVEQEAPFFAVIPPSSGGGASFPTGALIDLKFNNDVTDASGNGNNGTVTGTTTFTTGQDTVANHAFSFNAATTVDLSDATVAAFTSSDFSISFWINVDSGKLSTTPIVISKGAFQQTGYYILLNANGSVTVTLNQSGANQDVNSNSGAVVEGTYCNIVFVRTGTAGKIYKNGADVTASSASLTNPDLDGTRPFRLGNYSGNGFPVQGAVDEVAVWSRALSSTEVGNIFSVGAR